MKLVQAARLSRLTDSTTSMDKQDNESGRYADAYGHEIVGTAADTDVSGDVPPWDRPELGPWLTDPEKIGQYDGIIAAHLDRLSRSTIDFMRLLQWAEEHGKTIITIQPQVDFSTPVGKLIGYIISWLAEQELAAIKRRTQGTFAWLRDNGYLTGKCPFGFRVKEIQVEGKIRKIIELDPETAPIVHEMVDKYLSGSTFNEICGWLDKKGIPPQQNSHWKQQSITQIFRNPVLIGRFESKGQIVRGADGLPLQRCEPILDMGTWKQLQDKLDAHPRSGVSTPRDTAMLVGVLFCENCQGAMYHMSQTQKKKSGKQYEYKYYRCHGTQRDPSKCRNMIHANVVEQAVNDSFIETFGYLPMVEKRVIPGSGHEQRLADIGQAIAELANECYVRGSITEDDYERMRAELKAERNHLASLPAEPDKVEYVPTGITWGEHWDALDKDEKRAFLRGKGVKVFAQSRKGEPPSVRVEGGDFYAVGQAWSERFTSKDE